MHCSNTSFSVWFFYSSRAIAKLLWCSVLTEPVWLYSRGHRSSATFQHPRGPGPSRQRRDRVLHAGGAGHVVSPARAAAPDWCVPCLNWVCEQDISSGKCWALGTVTAAPECGEWSGGCVPASGSRGSGTAGAKPLQGSALPGWEQLNTCPEAHAGLLGKCQSSRRWETDAKTQLLAFSQKIQYSLTKFFWFQVKLVQELVEMNILQMLPRI